MVVNMGFSGKAKAGKDTAAQALVQDMGYTRIAFADALKAEVFRVFASNTLLIGVSDDAAIAAIDSIKHQDAIRQYLQSFGAWRRQSDPDYWIRQTFNRIQTMGDHNTPFVITDVRYRNEAEYLHKQGWKIVRIERPGFDNGLTEKAKQHPSETELDNYPADYTIYNRWDIDTLQAAARQAARDFEFYEMAQDRPTRFKKFYEVNKSGPVLEGWEKK